MPVTALACDCARPLPEYDQETFEEADIIGHFEVIEVVMPTNWSGDAPALSEITLRVIDLYKGDAETERVKVYSDMRNGCALYVESGTNDNLLLYDRDGKYILAGQCTDLSDEGWKRLKEDKLPANSTE